MGGKQSTVIEGDIWLYLNMEIHVLIRLLHNFYILVKYEINCMSSLPEKSRKKYEAVYQAFMDWRSLKNDDSFSEELFLTYFEKLAETYSSASLYAYYSMLRSTLKSNYDVDLGTYSKLRDFLKQKSEGYQSKKSKTFTTHEVNKFISEAPDKVYLATKVRNILDDRII